MSVGDATQIEKAPVNKPARIFYSPVAYWPGSNGPQIAFLTCTYSPLLRPTYRNYLCRPGPKP